MTAPTRQAVMIRRIDPADLDAVAQVFRDHDRSALPGRLGVRRRTLLHYHGLYLHLIEGDPDFQDRLYASRDDPLFREVDQELAMLLTPYDARRPSMREAQAEAFYHWRDEPPVAAYRVLLEIRAEPGRGAEFERAWRRLAVGVGRQPANVTQSLSRDPEEPDTYYVVSDWTDEGSFRRFAADPEHRKLAETVQSLGRTVRMTCMHIREQDPA